jgi:hypothetical protein
VATTVDDGTVIFGETRRPFDLLLGVLPHRIAASLAGAQPTA